MSVNLMSAIFEVEFFDLKDRQGNITKASTAKLVLLAMADHANDEGEGAYPSVDKLARKTALSPQTIRNTLDALRYNGIIALAGTSKYRTNNHTINTKCFPARGGKKTARLTLYPLEGTTGEAPPSNRSSLDPLPVRPESLINHPLTVPKSVFSEANKTVDKILGLQETINQHKGQAWKFREQFRDNHLPYADWWHGVSGMPASKADVRDCQKAFADWEGRGLGLEYIQAAYDAMKKWRKVISSPNALTRDAAALQAMEMVRPETPQIPRFIPPVEDESKYIPNPTKRQIK